MNQGEVAGSLETFLRESFAISPTDPNFGREVDLFDGGYVDSVGLAETLAFVEEEFGVSMPDDELLSDDFATIDGMARAVVRLLGGS
ncbi:MAG TPA: phosphopantetheine-binding protein [Thermoleophilaceae bacterium]|nr:phosphopantetheine-binding protein [Thermoleophilaceae bacterium]